MSDIERCWTWIKAILETYNSSDIFENLLISDWNKIRSVSNTELFPKNDELIKKIKKIKDEDIQEKHLNLAVSELNIMRNAIGASKTIQDIYMKLKLDNPFMYSREKFDNELPYIQSQIFLSMKKPKDIEMRLFFNKKSREIFIELIKSTFKSNKILRYDIFQKLN